MNEEQALSQMVYPSMRRENKHSGGVIQIWVTRACDRACYHCTQGSNLRAHPEHRTFMTTEQFETAVLSLKDYFGIVGVFGGNPTLHPEFRLLCEILQKHIPFARRGLWCNHPRGHGKVMRETFNPAFSNLNVHLCQEAYDEFKRDWPESRPFGLKQDSRHGPPFVALQDVIDYEEDRWDEIVTCDINRFWSAMIGVFRGELRAWFCEIAGAQSILHQHEEDYPDTGVPVSQFPDWWKLGPASFANQVRFHCHACGVPLRGRGELACAEDGVEQVSRTHADIYRPKEKGREIQLVVCRSQLGEGILVRSTDYLGNAKR